jgi:hypothetical protein
VWKEEETYRKTHMTTTRSAAAKEIEGQESPQEIGEQESPQAEPEEEKEIEEETTIPEAAMTVRKSTKGCRLWTVIRSRNKKWNALGRNLVDYPMEVHKHTRNQID